MEFKINTTALDKEKRGEMAKMLFECGYSIKLQKSKDGSKINYFIVCEGK